MPLGRAGELITVLPRRPLIILAMLSAIHSAHAHGIAGNRFFPGTLSFDDPAVADEAIVPNFSSFKRPNEDGNVVDNRFDWAFFRLLTPTLGFGRLGLGYWALWISRNSRQCARLARVGNLFRQRFWRPPRRAGMAAAVRYHRRGDIRTPDDWKLDKLRNRSGRLGPTLTRNVDTLHWG